MLMKKIFSLCAAFLAAMTINAAELTLDLNAAQGYAQYGSGQTSVTNDVLNVMWNVTEGWSVAGAAFELDNLTSVSKIKFDYTGDGMDVDMLVYLEDANGNKKWDGSVGGLSLSETGWVPVELSPVDDLWSSGEEPWVKLIFVANPATATEGVFYLRNVKIEYEAEEPVSYIQEDIALDLGSWGWGYNSQVVQDGDMLKCTLTGEWGAMSTGWDPTIDLSSWDRIVIVVENMSGCDGEWFKLKAYLRDNTESEANQMEGQLGLDAPDNEKNYLVIDLHQEKACDLTQAKILAIQCQPNGAVFKISRVYLEKEGEIVVPKPETAPAAPQHEEADVLAMYCNHYAENNLHFETQGWGGTNWETLNIEGTDVRYTEGLTWEMMTNWDADSYDFSEYAKFHFDVWVPFAAVIQVTFEAQSGWKHGITFNLNEGWNTIDCDPAWWITEEAPYDWKDVKYIAFEGYKFPEGESAEGNPLDRKSTRLNSSHELKSRMPSSA